MLVRNESRIKMIHDIQHFHVPRQLLHTIRIRLEVRASTCGDRVCSSRCRAQA